MQEMQAGILERNGGALRGTNAAAALSESSQGILDGTKNGILLVGNDASQPTLLLEALEDAGFKPNVQSSIGRAQALTGKGAYLALIFRLNLGRRKYYAVMPGHQILDSSLPLSLFEIRDNVLDRAAMEALISCLKQTMMGTFPSRGAALGMGNLELITDVHGGHILIDGMPHYLPATDLIILEALLRRPGHVASKALLLDLLTGNGSQVNPNTIEVYVHRLRKNLSDRHAKVQIETARGVGYLMRELH